MFFYRAFAPACVIDSVRACTDEDIEIHQVAFLSKQETVNSVRWLIPLALDPNTYAPVDLTETVSATDRQPRTRCGLVAVPDTV